jgi:uncharacterized membrane protein YkoI
MNGISTLRITLVALGCTATLAATAGAQATAGTQATPQPKTDIPAALAKKAKISLDSARTIATHRVPNATIASQELERENGRLIYSFDMKVAGKAGVEEVNVNALNGRIVGVSHEGPAAEKKEAAAEKKEVSKKH